MRMSEERAVASLKKIVSQERDLYKKYKTLLLKERELMREQNIKDMQIVSQKRMALTEQMLQFQDKRFDVMRAFTPDIDVMPLREWIRTYFSATHSNSLLPLAESLRSEIEEVRSEEKLHGSALQFALRMFSGLTSIIRSASQNILTSYSKKGAVKESFNPQTRNSGVLKEV